MSNVYRLPLLPRTRGDCAGEPDRLCPVLRCRYHMVSDNLKTRRLLRQLARRQSEMVRAVLLTELTDELEAAGHSWCSLDHAADGLTLDAIGQLWGMTRERVRQIEQVALRRLNNPGRKDARQLREAMGWDE